MVLYVICRKIRWHILHADFVQGCCNIYWNMTIMLKCMTKMIYKLLESCYNKHNKTVRMLFAGGNVYELEKSRSWFYGSTIVCNNSIHFPPLTFVSLIQTQNVRRFGDSAESIIRNGQEIWRRHSGRRHLETERMSLTVLRVFVNPDSIQWELSIVLFSSFSLIIVFVLKSIKMCTSRPLNLAGKEILKSPLCL